MPDENGSNYKRRRALIDAALRLSAEDGFSGLLPGKIAREAHLRLADFEAEFRDMDDLALALAFEIGQFFRHVTREARHEAAAKGSMNEVVHRTVRALLEDVAEHPHTFRLLVAECAGTSQAFRRATRREIRRLVDDLEADMQAFLASSGREMADLRIVAEAIVSIYLAGGAEALEIPRSEWPALAERIEAQANMVQLGAIARAQGWSPSQQPV